MTRAVLRACAAAALWFGLAGVAQAHPHVFVTASEELLFGPDGQVSGVRHAWTFDDMYSAFITQGLAAPGQVATREQLAPLAKTNVQSLAEFAYFTIVKAAGKGSDFGEPTDAWSEESADRRVTLHFTLPLKAPASAARALTLTVYDPTYFVAFTLAEHDPVALVGAPGGCSASVYKPKALDPSETRALNESFFTNLSPGADFGAKLAEKAVVACP